MKSSPTIFTATVAGPLLPFIAQQRGCSLRKAKALLDQRVVLVNGRRIWMARHPLRPGDRVEIPPTALTAPAPGHAPVLRVLFENGDFVVFDKPAGWLSSGPKSLETHWQRDPRWITARAVHRLDRDTTGTLCAALRPETYDRLVLSFRRGHILKVYHAIVAPGPTEQQGTICRSLEGKTAITHWTVCARSRTAVHLRLKIDTGRTHQIRKHLSGQGWPVVGDRQYRMGTLHTALLRAAPRQMLHGAVLQAPLGPEGQMVRVDAPLPPDFRRTLRQFNLPDAD